MEDASSWLTLSPHPSNQRLTACGSCGKRLAVAPESHGARGGSPERLDRRELISQRIAFTSAGTFFFGRSEQLGRSQGQGFCSVKSLFCCSLARWILSSTKVSVYVAKGPMLVVKARRSIAFSRSRIAFISSSENFRKCFWRYRSRDSFPTRLSHLLAGG